jgi:hypothetical protein
MPIIRSCSPNWQDDYELERLRKCGRPKGTTADVNGGLASSLRMTLDSAVQTESIVTVTSDTLLPDPKTVDMQRVVSSVIST